MGERCTYIYIYIYGWQEICKNVMCIDLHSHSRSNTLGVLSYYNLFPVLLHILLESVKSFHRFGFYFFKLHINLRGLFNAESYSWGRRVEGLFCQYLYSFPKCINPKDIVIALLEFELTMISLFCILTITQQRLFRRFIVEKELLQIEFCVPNVQIFTVEYLLKCLIYYLNSYKFTKSS